MLTPLFLQLVETLLKLLLVVGITVMLIAPVFLLVRKNTNPFGKGAVKMRSKETASGIIFGAKYFGRCLACSPESDEGHMICFGGSGSGKTTSIVVPTLQQWDGTSFTIDISGDINVNVPSDSKLIFEPESPYSTPYNVFAAVDKAETEEEKNELLEQLALILMPNGPLGQDGASIFYNAGGRRILTAALIAFYHQGLDFVDICTLIIEKGWLELLKDIKATSNKKAYSLISGFQGANEKNTAGCKDAANEAIRLFGTNPKIRRTVRRPAYHEKSVSPAMLEKYSVYIVLDDVKLKLFEPLLQLITAQVLEHLAGRANKSDPPILLCLDEFPSLGKLEILGALQKLRKKNVRICVFTQSLADIDRIYGVQERKSMLDNFAFKVVLSASDVETQQYFSNLAGERTSVKKTITKSANGTSKTTCEQREKICYPEELARLGKSLVLLSPDGFQKLKKNFYFNYSFIDRWWDKYRAFRKKRCHHDQRE